MKWDAINNLLLYYYFFTTSDPGPDGAYSPSIFHAGSVSSAVCQQNDSGIPCAVLHHCHLPAHALQGLSSGFLVHRLRGLSSGVLLHRLRGLSSGFFYIG